MKSKKSFCNISAVLVARNLKQFWLLPFAGFLAYFIGDILPLLKFDIPKAKLYEQIYSQALHLSWWYIAACAIIPICASVAVFASMHNSANATVLHSQPFSRKKLFRSNVLSGWLLTIIPVLLMGLGFVIFVNISNFYSLTELFSVKISVTLITVTYVYAVSVLAAMVAGTVVTHFLLCMFFNGVLPVTIYLVNKYLLTFLFGFSSPKFASTYFSPITWLNNSYMTDYNFYYFRVYLIYFILSLAIIWIAGRIYRKLPLEKEGVSVIFKWPGEIICYLFAFIGMTALAFLMRSLADGKQAVFFLGAFIGSILSYIIARMILEKTIFIFKKSFIIKYGIFVIASLLFFSVTIFDVTGYQTKVPKVEEIKEVYLEDSFGCREKALSNPQTLENN